MTTKEPTNQEKIQEMNERNKKLETTLMQHLAAYETILPAGKEGKTIEAAHDARIKNFNLYVSALITELQQGASKELIEALRVMLISQFANQIYMSKLEEYSRITQQTN